MTAYLLSLLLFYADSTGKPAYTLLADNMYRDTSDCWIQPQHRVQWGDLNCDGIVDSKDLWIYIDTTGEIVGWTVNGEVAHPDDTCYALQRSTKPKTIKQCTRICLPCAARRIAECHQ